MVISEEFKIVVSARADPDSTNTGPVETYKVEDGYFMNGTLNTKYGWTYTQDNFYGRNPNINVSFDDKIDADDGRDDIFRTVHVSATVSGKKRTITEPFPGGGSVTYTFIGQKIKMK